MCLAPPRTPRADAAIVNSSDANFDYASSDRLKLPVVTKKNLKILQPSEVRALDEGGNKWVWRRLGHHERTPRS
jgi:hypothetical protein